MSRYGHVTGFSLAKVTVNYETCNNILLFLSHCYIDQRVIMDIVFVFSYTLLCLSTWVCKVHLHRYCTKVQFLNTPLSWVFSFYVTKYFYSTTQEKILLFTSLDLFIAFISVNIINTNNWNLTNKFWFFIKQGVTDITVV